MDYLHNHSQFENLIRILEGETDIQAGLIEKDYWIMHVLYGLQKQEYEFELKGGTSLSKGFGLIERFSEDIDIRIEPKKNQVVATNPKQEKTHHIESKKNFYNQLCSSAFV